MTYIPKGSLLKELPASQYAVAKFGSETDITDAWTEFFLTAIPTIGYIPVEGALYFGYYPMTYMVIMNYGFRW